MHDPKAVDGLHALGSTKNIDSVSTAYVEGKATSVPHKRRVKSSALAFELMYTDIFGSIEPDEYMVKVMCRCWLMVTVEQSSFRLWQRETAQLKQQR